MTETDHETQNINNQTIEQEARKHGGRVWAVPGRRGGGEGGRGEGGKRQQPAGDPERMWIVGQGMTTTAVRSRSLCELVLDADCGTRDGDDSCQVEVTS